MLLSTSKPELDAHLNPFMTYLVSQQQASIVDNTSDLYTNYLNGIYHQQQQQQQQFHHQQLFIQQRFLNDSEGNYGYVICSINF